MTHKHTNNLIHESSPYLLQHAHNPVHWEAWSQDLMARAKRENKLVLVSIGYAACHWCHVMEHECFEDETVADVMNEHFICIKIDREERPDIDHIYMDALQMMTGSGGWPLNVVTLPDGRPFWGATYVKKQDWITVLQQLADLYQKEPKKVIAYAENLAEGIRTINLVEKNEGAPIFSMEQLDEAIVQWSSYFDTFLGGHKRAPKFMMPCNLDFLLHYATIGNDQAIKDYVNVTLTRMANGGIFDHIGGGFSRYAVDTKWHVPHFEKMLYDNGQMVSLYAQAYATTKKTLYKKTVKETIDFITTELMAPNYGFYSSLDADSLNTENKLEEGAYYVWTVPELENLLGDQFKIFKDYYNINDYGHWEHGNYVLIKDAPDKEIAAKHTITIAQLNATIEACKDFLKKERKKRNRPRLDDKILTSWNGLMLKGLVDAYRYLQNDDYLDLAVKNANFILNHLTNEEGGLFHNHKNGTSSINGFLEDYVSVIEALFALYEVTFDEHWLLKAKELLDFCITNFYDEESALFFFTAKSDAYVIRRTLEVADNVIPASNSIMAHCLFKIGKLFPIEGYGDLAQQMLLNVQENFTKNAQGHANWLHLVLYHQLNFYEIAIVGDESDARAKELNAHYLPQALVAGSNIPTNDLLLLQNRFVEGATPIYICQEGSCKLPVHTIEETLLQMSAISED
ncbi:thioredoxin [Sediminicola sp. YIK13]|uniref:thioredoxin domain-containing protein n=1 Tax=Sediminicola sp. YIK13 TaxID=1453352 RepID=UPI00072057A3|nr:thioredoxin domain-containing protein [Sediminicola sp. YIK13]ALM08929.1 thioredoxin [Sediminicola sp. YIK13]